MPRLHNQREELFVRGVLTGLSKARAAVHAGYSSRSSMQIGSEISRRPHVQRRMDELRAVVVRVFNAIDGEPEAGREFEMCAHKLHGSR
jgi:phage terminase small subunit